MSKFDRTATFAPSTKYCVVLKSTGIVVAVGSRDGMRAKHAELGRDTHDVYFDDQNAHEVGQPFARAKPTGPRAPKTPRDETKVASPETTARKPRTLKQIVIPNATSLATVTLARLANDYIENLLKNGTADTTARSYKGDLDVALEVLGAETAIAAITPADVQRFIDAPAVTTKSDGSPKSKITIDKTRRVFRQLLAWASTSYQATTAAV